MMRTFLNAVRRQSLLFSVLFILTLAATLAPLVDASSHGKLHHGDHHQSRDTLDRGDVSGRSVGPEVEQSSSPSIDDAKDIIKRAMKALAIANKLRLDNPQFNKYEFQNTSAIAQKYIAAPPLDYGQGNSASNISSRSNGHVSSRSANSTKPIASKGSYSYSIPDELAEAARIVAESQPISNTNLNYAVNSAPLPGTNDTNAMAQAILQPDGLHGFVPNGTGSTIVSLDGSDSSATKRATSSFWMENMAQNGVSPFAPSGYKVWRNVKDYGAQGDGITDDTAAINRAISDGGRCGAACGSSTIYPAFVYFPAGTYLVSSPIIQYYYTQIFGDPTNLPTIVAAASFVGLGVITSDVYTGETTEWYLNTNNFLRSVKNLNMDISRTELSAQVCAIHWQVAQGTSLENIYFLMSSAPGSTQQGIYMENGSGGWLSDLTFTGGKFGAFLGNQQFTCRNLVFRNCETALQISWDWSWMMQGIDIQNSTTGVIIVGGAGGPLSTYQGVGSLTLIDLSIKDTALGIQTSLFQANSTALLIQNAYLDNVARAVTNDVLGNTLLAGSSGVTLINSWGFGLMADASGNSSFSGAENIPTMTRNTSLLDASTNSGMPQSKFFSRRRPQYTNIGSSQIFDVTEYGAIGDGKTDNTAVFNAIFAIAANMSSIVYVPFGVYMISDTVRLPVGTRVIGQAWSQIMATGPKFESASDPRVAVQVGKLGDIGVVEIQNMMFTVSGPTAGAILVEWNVHELSQGSAGMWDSHIRVGGAIGSNLQKGECPANSGSVNPDCIAASLLFHMTSTSSAYIENAWMWVADHDMDTNTQDVIDVYSARGLLIESKGPTWLYGTSVEHNVLYQYQLSGAENIMMGVIQTESPYFQAVPAAPAPFKTGLFPNDPTFSNCTSGSVNCALSWAVRIIDSSTIYLLGTGLYSWFQDYTQTCLNTESCQSHIFNIEQSSDIWIYNLVTKGAVEMISPSNGIATLSSANQNGFTASLLAWLQGTNTTVGARIFPGFQVYPPGFISTLKLPATCQTALTTTIYCDDYISPWIYPAYRGSLDNQTLTDSICDPGCGLSVASYFNTVSSACADYTVAGAPPSLYGGYIYQGWNETCLFRYDVYKTWEYINDDIAAFTVVDDVSDMPYEQICNPIYRQRLEIMQQSSYSVYNTDFQRILEYVIAYCGLSNIATDIPPPLFPPTTPPAPLCVSNINYTTTADDTCDSIALEKSLSSAALFKGNPVLYNCSSIPAGVDLCLPLSCGSTYILQSNDTCVSISRVASIGISSIQSYNPWINNDCSNLQQASKVYGHVVCLAPQGGAYTSNSSIGGYNPNPFSSTQYGDTIIPPPINSTVAPGTTALCGGWYVAGATDTCTNVAVGNGVTYSLFLAVNPSLPPANCTTGLVKGLVYCVHPLLAWNTTDLGDLFGSNPSSTTTSYSTTTSTFTGTSSTTTGTSDCTSASVLPAPSQYASSCGLPGFSHDSPTSLSIAAYTSGPYVVSAAACGAQCLTTATCTNFYFIEGEQCKLHKGDSTFAESTAAGYYTWFEASCFSSGQACGSPGSSHDTVSKQIGAYTSGSVYVSSAAACGALCLSTPTCTNIYFVQDANCKLHSGEYSYAESTASGYSFWYPLECFVCNASS